MAHFVSANKHSINILKRNCKETVMNAKLHNLGELSKFLEDKDTVSRELLSLSGKFQAGTHCERSGLQEGKGNPL